MILIKKRIRKKLYSDKTFYQVDNKFDKVFYFGPRERRLTRLWIKDGSIEVNRSYYPFTMKQLNKWIMEDDWTPDESKDDDC